MGAAEPPERPPGCPAGKTGRLSTAGLLVVAAATSCARRPGGPDLWVSPPGDPSAWVASPSCIDDVAVDDKSVYLLFASSIVRLDKMGRAAPATLWSFNPSGPSAFWMGAGPENLYFTQGNGFFRVRKIGGPPTLLSRDGFYVEGNPWIDEDGAYWFEGKLPYGEQGLALCAIDHAASRPRVLWQEDHPGYGVKSRSLRSLGDRLYWSTTTSSLHTRWPLSALEWMSKRGGSHAPLFGPSVSWDLLGNDMDAEYRPAPGGAVLVAAAPDGTSELRVVREGTASPTTLAKGAAKWSLNLGVLHGETVYWYSRDDKAVQRSRLDGSQPETVLAAEQMFPSAPARAGKELLWIDDAIADLSGVGLRKWRIDPSRGPKVLVVVGETYLYVAQSQLHPEGACLGSTLRRIRKDQSDAR
jgi:hypothetical protein